MRAALLLLVAALTALAAADTLYLTVLYCPPGLSSSKGATVTVDPVSGAWNVVGTFDWGKELGVGCLIEGTVISDASGVYRLRYLSGRALIVILLSAFLLESRRHVSQSDPLVPVLSSTASVRLWVRVPRGRVCVLCVLCGGR